MSMRSNVLYVPTKEIQPNDHNEKLRSTYHFCNHKDINRLSKCFLKQDFHYCQCHSISIHHYKTLFD